LAFTFHAFTFHAFTFHALRKVSTMNIQAYNREAWNEAVARGSEWSIPVSLAEVEAARRGEWRIILTPEKAVPREWLPAELKGADLLCLASGGGQQGPILAAVGANVTVFDNSDAQLARDREVAARDGLTINTVRGDMADLSVFADASFDCIVHPVSNLFVPDVRPVWNEAFRVLRPGGVLLSGFMNPAFYLFDADLAEDGNYVVSYKLPYSDLESLPPEVLRRYAEDKQPLEFGHTLQDQIGGQIDAGFVITGFYEDRWPGQYLSEYMDAYIATRALKQ